MCRTRWERVPARGCGDAVAVEPAGHRGLWHRSPRPSPSASREPDSDRPGTDRLGIRPAAPRRRPTGRHRRVHGVRRGRPGPVGRGHDIHGHRRAGVRPDDRLGDHQHDGTAGNCHRRCGAAPCRRRHHRHASAGVDAPTIAWLTAAALAGLAGLVFVVLGERRRPGGAPCVPGRPAATPETDSVR